MRKINAGAAFLVSQPVFEVNAIARFLEEFRRVSDGPVPVPIYWGLQLLEQGGVTFGPVPPETQRQVEAGRSGVDIGLELYAELRRAGIGNLYLLPSIRPGGERGYPDAQEFMVRARSLG